MTTPQFYLRRWVDVVLCTSTASNFYIQDIEIYCVGGILLFSRFFIYFSFLEVMPLRIRSRSHYVALIMYFIFESNKDIFFLSFFLSFFAEFQQGDFTLSSALLEKETQTLMNTDYPQLIQPKKSFL